MTLDNAKLQVSLVTTLSFSALSILLVSLWPNASPLQEKNCPALQFQSRSFSCSVIFHPNSKLASHPLFSLSAPARPKSAKPITATCRVAYSMFPCFLWSISISAVSSKIMLAATKDLLQSPHRSKIHNFTLLFHFHIPRTVPSLSAFGNYGYLASLSPCAWAGICHISQLHGSHLQIPMYVCAHLARSPRTHASPPSDTSDAHPRATVRRLTCFPCYAMFAHIHQYHVSFGPRRYLSTLVEVLLTYTYQLPSFLYYGCRIRLISFFVLPGADARNRLP